jgi:hypothetical protein
VASLISSLGILISFYNVDSNYNIFLIIVLISYLLFIHSKKIEAQPWEQLNLQDAEEEGFQSIKKRLCNQGLFVKTFRDLIFLGRQNFSHRTLL